jgi:signal transduction histidine kinase
VVQESLTNALKHGTGTAELRIAWPADGVHVEVRNPPRTDGPPAPGGGHGLVGMRERIAAVGGRFSNGPTPDGSFTVCAQIPRTTA